MEYFRDQKYPNGWTKSRLYEVLLNPYNLDVSDAQYGLDLEFAKIDEKNQERNCAWFKDDNSNLLVADLRFRDDVHLQIIEDGFEFIRKPSEYRKLKIFISYAREDFESAGLLYNALMSEGLKPWMDQEGLLGGERWKVRVPQLIANSDFFIALLSSGSVAKQGYVQKEIRLAIEMAEQMPESNRFIIPVRLDDCESSHALLRDLTRIDMFPDWTSGVQKIVRSLRTI